MNAWCCGTLETHAETAVQTATKKIKSVKTMPAYNAEHQASIHRITVMIFFSN